MIQLSRKIIHYGTKITYICVRTPTQTKYSFGIAHLPFRRAVRVFKDLPYG